MASNNQILLYQTEDGETRLEVLHLDETVWLTQRGMAELFQRAVNTINEHIAQIYKESELSEGSTIRNFRIVQMEGNRRVTREVVHYNLDMIISVGYRVNSYRGTQFRIWATLKLTEFIRKGFIMDDDRLAHGGSNYFDELQERIRRIRNSEYNFSGKSAKYSPLALTTTAGLAKRACFSRPFRTSSITPFTVTQQPNSFGSA